VGSSSKHPEFRSRCLMDSEYFRKSMQPSQMKVCHRITCILTDEMIADIPFQDENLWFGTYSYYIQDSLSSFGKRLAD